MRTSYNSTPSTFQKIPGNKNTHKVVRNIFSGEMKVTLIESDKYNRRVSLWITVFHGTERSCCWYINS